MRRGTNTSGLAGGIRLGTPRTAPAPAGRPPRLRCVRFWSPRAGRQGRAPRMPPGSCGPARRSGRDVAEMAATSRHGCA